MANCKQCGIEVSGKYEYCFECNKKQQDSKAKSGEAIVDGLSKINNNLYFIRTALAVVLKQNHNCEVVWNKDKKDFEVIVGKFEENTK